MRALALYRNTKVVMINGKKVGIDYQPNWSSIDSLGSFHNILKQDGDLFGIKIRIS